MKKKNYPLGYKMVLFLAFSCFMGNMAFATVPQTSESQREAVRDSFLEALVQENQKKQEQQEAISASLKERNVIGVVVEKEDGSLCQISKEENPESYVPSFMNVGDSLEDFGLSACGEEELATLEHTAQVAAIEGGPSQAKVAAVMPALIGIGAAVGCGYGVYKSAFIDDKYRAKRKTTERNKNIFSEIFRETVLGTFTVLSTMAVSVGLEMTGVIAASSKGPMVGVVAAPIGTYIACKTGGTFLYYITD